MTVVVVLASMALAAVAAFGVLRPFGRSGQPTLERLADPLEDERLSLLRALRDLDRERDDGELSEATYRILRGETEGRAVAVLRALEARDGAGELAAGLKELRTIGTGNGSKPSGQTSTSPSRRGLRLVGPVAAGVVLAGVVGVLLVGSIGGRTADQAITGSGTGGGTISDALTFFKQRVQQHPKDVAARLDLAQQYLDQGDAQDAIPQYLAALQLDPKSPQAHAELGFVLFRAGKAEDGLRAVNQALAVDPSYAEALYFKGVILYQGLNRPEEAAVAFQAYLANAPFGSRRAEVQALLARIKGGSTP